MATAKPTLRQRIINWALRHEPDLWIGGKEDPYLIRWHFIKRNRWFNIYIHKFCRSDDDRALHDHPWLFNVSWLLRGNYIEHAPRDAYCRLEGKRKYRFGPAPHRVELYQTRMGQPKPVWTLFITGPVVREWGFYCERGWLPWQKFLEVTGDESLTTKGCE